MSRKKNSPLAAWSLALGCIGWGCLIIPGSGLAAVAAVVCGHLARRTSRKEAGAQTGTGLALGGLALGYARLAFAIVTTLLLPATTNRREEAQTAQCRVNLSILSEAKEQAIGEKRLRSGDSVSESDIAPHLLIKGRLLTFAELACPTGGRYSIGKVGEPLSCDKHGRFSAPLANVPLTPTPEGDRPPVSQTGSTMSVLTCTEVISTREPTPRTPAHEIQSLKKEPDGTVKTVIDGTGHVFRSIAEAHAFVTALRVAPSAAGVTSTVAQAVADQTAPPAPQVMGITRSGGAFLAVVGGRLVSAGDVVTSTHSGTNVSWRVTHIGPDGCQFEPAQ